MPSYPDSVTDKTRFLTIKEVEATGFGSRTSIWRAMKSGALPYLKIGRAVRIPREGFEAYVDSLKVGA